MAGDSNPEIGDTMTLYVRCPSNGTKFAVEARLDATVESLKSVIEEKCEIESWEQSLIYKGCVLNNDQSLQSYGLEAEDTVHMARGYVPGCGRSPPRVNGVVPLQHTPSMVGPVMHIIQNMHDSDPQFRAMVRNPDFRRLLPEPMSLGRLITLNLCVFSGLDRVASQTGGAAVTPEEVYANLHEELEELGFFDVTVDVESSNSRFTVETSLLASVDSFKSILEPMFEIPAGRQCLICQGGVLEDGHTLLSYGGLSDIVYLIVMDGPPQNTPANRRTAGARTSTSSPAYVAQGMYDSDPLFREMMKNPVLCRQFFSPTSMTEEEIFTTQLSLLWELDQPQTEGNARQTRRTSGGTRRNRRRR